MCRRCARSSGFESTKRLVRRRNVAKVFDSDNRLLWGGAPNVCASFDRQHYVKTFGAEAMTTARLWQRLPISGRPQPPAQAARDSRLQPLSVIGPRYLDRR